MKQTKASGSINSVRRQQRQGTPDFTHETPWPLIQASPLAIVALDAEGNVLSWNPAAEHMFGWSESEVLGRPIPVIPPDQHEAFRALLAGELEGAARAGIELRRLKKDGSLIDVHLWTTPLHNEEGSIAGTIRILADITTRKQAAAQIQYQAHLLNNVHDAVIATDEQLRITAWNKAAEAMYGWKAEEVMCRPIREVIRSDFSHAQQTEALHRLAETGHYEVTVDQYRRDGQPICIEGKTIALRGDDGRITGYVAVNRDVTDQQRMLAALRESEERYRLLVELSRDAIGIISEGNVVFINKAGAKLLGAEDPRQIIGRPFMDFVLPDQVEISEGRRRQLAQGQGVPLREVRALRLDGSVVDVESWAMPFTYQGKPAALFVSRDITRRKQAEEALRSARDYLQHVLESSPAVIYALAIEADTFRPTWVSDNIAHMLGYAAQETLAPDWWVDHLHPDDRPRMLSEQALPFPNDLLVREYRLRRKEGGYRWIRDESRLMRDSAGQPVEVIGSWSDITGRKQTEEEVRRQTARAEALLQTASRLNAQHSLEGVIRVVCEETARVLNVPAVGVSLYNETQDVLEYAGGFGLEARLQNRLRPTSRAVLERLVRKAGALIVIPDAQAFPHLPNSEVYAELNARTLVYAVMLGDGHLVGVLTVGTLGQVRHFTQDELDLLKGLADQAKLAIVNARLLAEVRASHAHLRSLSRQLLNLQESERRYIAQELHDQVGQNLSALSVNLNIIRDHLSLESKTQIQNWVDDSSRLLETSMEQIRDVMARLRPPVLEDYGLIAALRWYAEQFAKRTGIPAAVQGDEPAPRPSPAAEIALFRIAQEALTNVSKHARARQVTLTLELKPDCICLTVADDGVGFDPAAVRRAGEQPGWGLLNMRERAEALGGRFHLESAPGQGTHITGEVPR